LGFTGCRASVMLRNTAQEAEAMHMLAYLRRGHLQTIASDPLSIARGLLREAVALYGKGDKDKAYQKAVEAYLDGYEPWSHVVRKDAGLVELEVYFTQLRNAIKQGEPQEQVQKRHMELK
jgi:hypothetical protein